MLTIKFRRCAQDILMGYHHRLREYWHLPLLECHIYLLSISIVGEIHYRLSHISYTIVSRYWLRRHFAQYSLDIGHSMLRLLILHILEGRGLSRFHLLLLVMMMLALMVLRFNNVWHCRICSTHLIHKFICLRIIESHLIHHLVIANHLLILLSISARAILLHSSIIDSYILIWNSSIIARATILNLIKFLILGVVWAQLTCVQLIYLIL